MFRKIIHIDAADSPNVKEGQQVISGLVTLEEYNHRLATWDPVMVEIGIRGRHYKGAELLLFPPQWLNRAEEMWRRLHGDGNGTPTVARVAKVMGCDPGEGVANTCWAIGDEMGLIELVSAKTPNTFDVVTRTKELWRKYPSVTPENTLFDRGGGGKQHADTLRSMGHDVRTVGFGESLVLDPRRGLRPLGETKGVREERSIYRNRRAQMYGIASELLNPVREMQVGESHAAVSMAYPSPYGSITSFAIPPVSHGPQYGELRRQLAKIPKLRSGEGGLELPPKNRRPGEKETSKKTLVEMLGCSPDEADAFVLMCYGLVQEGQQSVVTMY